MPDGKHRAREKGDVCELSSRLLETQKTAVHLPSSFHLFPLSGISNSLTEKRSHPR